MDELDKTGISAPEEIPSYRNGRIVTVPEGVKLNVLFLYIGRKELIKGSEPVKLHKLVNEYFMGPMYAGFNEYLTGYGVGVLACGRTNEQTAGIGLSLNWFDERRKEDSPESIPTITALRPDSGRCQGFFYVKEVEGRRHLYWHDPNSTNGSCVGHTLENPKSQMITAMSDKMQVLKGKSGYSQEDILIAAADHLRKRLLNPKLAGDAEYSLETAVREAQSSMEKKDSTQFNDKQILTAIANYFVIGNIIDTLRNDHEMDTLHAKSIGSPFIDDDFFQEYASYLRNKYAADSRLRIHTIFDPSLLFEKFQGQEQEYVRPKGAPRFQHIRLMDLDDPEKRFVFIEFGGIQKGSFGRKYDCQMLVTNADLEIQK